MSDDTQNLRFDVPPSTLSKTAFVERFGGIYEHSAWIAERTWDAGLSPTHDTLQGVADALASTLAGAAYEQKLALVRAHPDLVGKAAIAGELTEASTTEQASAGLDQCSAEEFRRFAYLNDRYWLKFDFPFVMAVRGQNRSRILEAFESRLGNDRESELQQALKEIDQIALLRLESMIS